MSLQFILGKTDFLIEMKLPIIKIAFGTILLLTGLYAMGIKLSPYAFDATDTDSILQSPSLTHWFGTDALGRDLFIRIIHAAQMSLSIAFLTGLMTLIIGLTLGLIAGYGKTWMDELIMRIIDLIYSLPDLLVLSIVALAVSRSTSGIIIGLAFINWMDLARLVRIEVQKLKSEEFIEASRVLGLNHLSIIKRHILPNIVGSIAVALSFTVARSILAESTLSFIGLGISPPNTSWGTLAGEGWAYLRTDPHMIMFPALVMFVTIYSLNGLKESIKQH